MVFVALTGGGVLDPRDTEWLLRRPDVATGFLGWQFYRRAPLAFPLGANPAYGLEMGSSVVFTDSIPLLAFAFKPFAAWLPAAFQYYGLWILLCCMLQSAFAYLLLRRFIDDRRLALTASLFFAIAPVCLVRLDGHFALFGQWLVLGALYLYFSPRWTPWRWSALLVTAALVHFYLLSMALALWIADLWQRCWRSETPGRAAAAQALGLAAALGFVLWAAGYFMIGGSFGEPGFGRLRMNLFAPFDPDDLWSFVLPDLSGSEWEGFNYLGLGLLVLAVPAGYALVRRRPLGFAPRAAAPLVAVCLLLTLFALSNHVAAGGVELVTYALPQLAVPYAEVLRSSGRMFWPVYYLIALGILVVVCRAFPPRIALASIGAALALQVADASAGMRHFMQRFVEGPAWSSPLRSQLWPELGRRYQRVVAVLPRNAPDTFLPWAVFAEQHGMATNFGYFARVDGERLVSARSALEEAVIANALDPHALYVFDDRTLWQLAGAQRNSSDVLGLLDGFRILAPRLHECAGCDLHALGDVRAERAGAYNLGERLTFAKRGTGRRAAEEGWSSPENWGTWSTGRRATLVFALDHVPAGDLVMTLEAQAFVNRRQPRQAVEVRANGVVLQTLVYERPQDVETRRVAIPHGAVRGERLVVEFVLPDAASPRELGLGDDGRKLGLGLIALRLSAR